MSDTSSNSNGGVDLSEFTIQRDEDGQIVPETNFVEEVDAEVTARPLNKSARRKYLQPLLNSEDGMSDKLTAEFFREHIVDPDPSNWPDEAVPHDTWSEEYVSEDMEDDLETGLIFGILLADGKEEAVSLMRKARDGELNVEEFEEGNQTEE